MLQVWDVLWTLTRLTRLQYDTTTAFADCDNTWLANVLQRCSQPCCSSLVMAVTFAGPAGETCGALRHHSRVASAHDASRGCLWFLLFREMEKLHRGFCSTSNAQNSPAAEPCGHGTALQRHALMCQMARMA